MRLVWITSSSVATFVVVGATMLIAHRANGEESDSDRVGHEYQRSLHKTVNSNMQDLMYCVHKNPGDNICHGFVNLRWTIGAKGQPRNISITRNTLKTRSCAECLVSKVRRWTFPPPTKEITVTYPFHANCAGY